MATAALRGLLVVAALALGFFVLSKAFPSGSEAPASAPVEDPSLAPSTSPSVVDSPIRNDPQPLPANEITLQVLNGTDTAGLAGDTADLLAEAEYDIRTVGDAETGYDITTIFYVPKRKVDAQILQASFFQTAVLEVAQKDVKVDITVILGQDYADSLESGNGGATPEETPS